MRGNKFSVLGLAQLVERQIVDLMVAGSYPASQPIFYTRLSAPHFSACQPPRFSASQLARSAHRYFPFASSQKMRIMKASQRRKDGECGDEK